MMKCSMALNSFTHAYLFPFMNLIISKICFNKGLTPRCAVSQINGLAGRLYRTADRGVISPLFIKVSRFYNNAGSIPFFCNINTVCVQ